MRICDHIQEIFSMSRSFINGDDDDDGDDDYNTISQI